MKRTLHIEAGNCIIVRLYDENDPIWQLPEEKRERQLLADAQRDLIQEADRRSAEQVTVRG